MAPTAKRKRPVESPDVVLNGVVATPLKRRSSARKIASTRFTTDPNLNDDIIDGPNALRASPDGDVNGHIAPGSVKHEDDDKPPIEAHHVVEPPKKGGRGKKATKESGKTEKHIKIEPITKDLAITSTPAKKSRTDADREPVDPEAEDFEPADEEEVTEALSRPPPVNSDFLPLPWKGRLGYACLNTYLRSSNPPVFSSRTCRIQSILEHRHPLQDPSQPEHATKNKPDRNKPADVERGQRYVESLGLANVKDIIKMVRWNDRYGIRLFRLSSEMFPFASHPEYGYKLAPFASEALEEAGMVIAQLGHRVTTHPGQFTQLGSPRKSVIDNAIRDLDYHAELLSLLKLPVPQDRDAVMILHMGGTFEGKEETLQRFRENYAGLSQNVKNRLVLENDDVGWTVHDLLPVCEELNIPLVLDYHHHNILFDSSKIREGTRDIMDLYDRIKATWARKNIKQKMHYSEPTPAAITPRQRRKHSPRVATLPPCAPDMDLMIEAKDKEQAVFELMRTFKLPGFEKIQDILPYSRNDDNKVALAMLAKKKKNPDEPDPVLIPDEDVGMGGPEGRVYWPPTMEEWLRPKKREVKAKKDPEEKTPAQKKKEEAAALYAARQAEKKTAQGGAPASEHEDSDLDATPATKKAKASMRKKAKVQAEKAAIAEAVAELHDTAAPADQTGTGKRKRGARPKKQAPPPVPTPSSSDELADEPELHDDVDEDDLPAAPAKRPNVGRKRGRRSAQGRVSYKEDDDDAVLDEE